MPKKAKELSALEVSRLNKPGNHAVGGVSGLYLYVNEAQGRSWVLRIMIAGQRKHLGLGGYPTVTLAQAREKARAARAQVEGGVDPIQQRRAAVSALRAHQAMRRSFKEVATSYIAFQEPAWKNPKHRKQWASTLETYAYPVIGQLSVDAISEQHVIAVLEPIWATKTETASRLRGRIESILDWARVRGHREGENPARWKGHLDKVFPAQGQIHQVRHLKAMSATDTPGFMARLAMQEGTSALALRFLILTAARSGEVRGAEWSEIDFDLAVWMIPASRMKAKRQHRVPLSNAALEVLQEARQCLPPTPTNLIFSNHKGGVLSDMSLTAVMRRMGVDAVPHGFRSTFRDWVGESTQYPSDLAEMALAHVLPNKTEAAYRRGDALEKRRGMMDAWAFHCLAAVTHGR
jgi:integrase